MLKVAKAMKTLMDNETAIRSLQECLERVPFLTLESIGKSGQPGAPDIEAQVRVGDQTLFLIAEVKSSGQPRIARQATYELREALDLRPNVYGILIAPYVSPEASRICKEAGVGFVDFAGNCHLAFERIYIDQQGRANPFGKRRDLRSLYSPKAERVLRVLLLDPHNAWKTEALAEAAQVSLGQVANVKALLADREWLNPQVGGVRLSAPGELLDEWAQQYRFRRNKVTDYYVMADVSEAEYQLADACRQRAVRYALTGFSGAARYAPMVRYQRGMAYVSTEVAEVAEALGWRSVETGANMSLLLPYDSGVFYGAAAVQQVEIVGLVQLYLDLQSYRGRGQEAAQAVRKELEKAWQ